ncbi:hypothetical protein V6N13_127829 [Hibiscus sabdariffa]|uniref:Uncharacterized protein n=1 Tax=Hibiscus sabdariffa TaxID=183260 RepID=A0ABR2CDU1_9ROSI
MAEQEQQQPRCAGKVLWFDDQKGFGFIHPDDGGEDLFVHQSSIKSDGYRSLAEGESVEFTVSQGNGGKTQAVDVTAIGGSHISKKDRRGGGGGGWRNDRRNGSGGCYNCGDPNHLARDCNNNAGSYENNDNYNNAGYGSGGGGSCYNCGESGHFARECRRDASGSAGGGAGKCYNCGKFGHFARDCNRNSGGGGGGRGCFNCGGSGHMARDCNNGNNNNRGTECFKCGEAGHFARECPNMKASA